MQYLRSRNSNCVLTPSKRWQKFIMAADMGLTFIVYCRMLQCGLPDAVFTILAGVHAAGGEIKEFLHLVEYFCGVASITSAWNASGMCAVGYDIENGKHDKMPIALKHEVEGNLKKYFDLWLKCGGNWKEIQMHLTYERVERNKKKGNFAWLREDQIRDQFPKAIAEAYIDQLFEKPGSYQEHPQLKGMREAAIYRVFISAEETGETEESTGVQARSTATLSDASDSTMGTMQSILGNASENEENGTHEMLSDTKIETRTPQEIALEQQEKLRLAEEKKRLLELKRADPMEQAKTWLAKLPTDIQCAKKKLIEITNSNVPSDLAGEYRELFDKHEKDL